MRLNLNLKQVLESSGISQNSLAKSIGVSPSAISQYLKDAYKGDVPALEVRLREFLSIHTEREATAAPTSSQVVETRSMLEICAVLRRATLDRDMTMATGESGIGKTTALREYHRRNPTTILIEADPGYTARALSVELCEQLGLDTRGTIHDLLKRMISKLSGSGRLIIIDEAEHLPLRCLELIRRVHDKAEVAVALVGMPRLKTNLQGDPNYFAQLYKRIGFHRPLASLTDKDVKALVTARIGAVDADVLSALRKACQSNARTLVKLLRQCLELMRLNECGIDPEIVASAELAVVIV